MSEASLKNTDVDTSYIPQILVQLQNCRMFLLVIILSGWLGVLTHILRLLHCSVNTLLS